LGVAPATFIRRNDEFGRLFERIDDLVKRTRLPDRSALSIFEAALGWSITNLRYRTHAEVDEYVASRDLKALCDAGLFEPIGEKRGRYYQRTGVLEQLRNSARIKKSQRTRMTSSSQRRSSSCPSSSACVEASLCDAPCARLDFSS
jgi:hypothetical protein